MGFWLKLGKWAVTVVGATATGALAATGFGFPLAAFVAGYTANLATMVHLADADDEAYEKRKKELEESTKHANAVTALSDIIDGANRDIKESQRIYEQDNRTSEDIKNALEHLSQAYIKVAGIDLSTNVNKHESNVIKAMENIRKNISDNRIAWRREFHKDYNADMADTHNERQKIRAELQSQYDKTKDKIKEDDSEGISLLNDLKMMINYLDGKVAKELQGFIDGLNEQVKNLKSLKQEHEELFNTAKTSVKNNADNAVRDAERALDARMRFDSAFKELINTLEEKQGKDFVLTPDILASIADFYAVFRDPEFLHNEVFEKAYQQQAERNKDKVFSDPEKVHNTVNEHLSQSKALHDEYIASLKNKNHSRARMLRYQVEAHQREAARIVEQLDAKFSVWSNGVGFKEKFERLRDFVKSRGNKTFVEWLTEKVNKHGDIIKRDMYLADLAEDDFYRIGLEKTSGYFAYHNDISKELNKLVDRVRESIPSFDARERLVKARPEAEEQKARKREVPEKVKAEEEPLVEEDDFDLGLPSVPIAPVVIGREPKDEKQKETAKTFVPPQASEPKPPIGELESPIANAISEGNVNPPTKEELDRAETKKEREAALNAWLLSAKSENIARQEAKAQKDIERWDKMSDEELSQKFDLIAEFFKKKDVEDPKLLFDGDLTVLDRLLMADLEDQENWEKRKRSWEANQLSHQERWASLPSYAKQQAICAYNSGYNRIYSFLELYEDLKIPQGQLKEMFISERKRVLNEKREKKTEEYRGRDYTIFTKKDVDLLVSVFEDTQRLKRGDFADDNSGLSDDLIKRLENLRRKPKPSESSKLPEDSKSFKVLSLDPPSLYPPKSQQDIQPPKRHDRDEVYTETEHSTDCIIRLPPIDTGEAFNSLKGKKMRIFKGSITVINTRDVEVGVYGETLHPIEELKGSPKTGEFPFLVYSDHQYMPELVIKHSYECPYFHLTSVTIHANVEEN
ncbi:hypothetical protein [Candidatus Liberibacter asiaticus]|uniref:hypothetical protein n=1 Tax=Liberibacter asiaticus TaxID=34021 RepID=UPI00405A05F1